MKLICALAVMASLAGTAHAGDKPPVYVETAAVPDKPSFTINPAKAYVLLRGDTSTAMKLARVADAEEQASYEAYRLREFEKAHAKYLKKAKLWEQQAKFLKASGKPLPPKPSEPLRDTFQVTPYEVLTMVSIGPIYRFAKSDTQSTYLQALTPGEYRLYGPIYMAAEGAIGSCYCMGSVKFTARAGEVTDLGVILTRGVTAPTAPQGDSSMPTPFAAQVFLGEAPVGMTLDPRIAGLPIRRAAFRPVGKLPNYYGVELGRIPAMAGVIGYDRDRILDLTVGEVAQ